ncbi:hypothetical protein ACTXG5_21950 [Mycobacterium sp. Dal123C01]|uniref:hypothetical protein n=1 Tax=Mycobacterium sp. Dal123C01 TaxID=3457577 RepID=UPI00403ED681
MTASRLVEYCSCGAPLRPANRSGVCAECSWEARNQRLLRMQREHDAQRRKSVAAKRLAELEKGNA